MGILYVWANSEDERSSYSFHIHENAKEDEQEENNWIVIIYINKYAFIHVSETTPGIY